MRFHPTMAATYRSRVSALIAGLSTGTELSEAKDALRAMIDRIVLTPSPDGDGLVVDIEGALAGLLRLATGLPVGQKAPTAVLQGADIADELVLVAGACNRLNLPQLRCAV